MGVIVDTSVWISVERGRLTPVQIADAVGNDAVYLAPQVVAELEFGVHRAATPAQRAKRMAAVARIKSKPCLTVDRITGELFASLAAQLADLGKPATHRTHDVWIAALALQHGYAVLTENPKDFADIPGLTVVTLKQED